MDGGAPVVVVGGGGSELIDMMGGGWSVVNWWDDDKFVLMVAFGVFTCSWALAVLEAAAALAFTPTMAKLKLV